MRSSATATCLSSAPFPTTRRPRVDGEPAYVLREDLDELTSTPVTSAVRLLPGYDQWVLGPGTADPHVVPPARRKLVSSKANLVIVGGAVSGTWTLTDDEVLTAWFAEAGPVPKTGLADEVQRLATILDRPLRTRVEMAEGRAAAPLALVDSRSVPRGK